MEKVYEQLIEILGVFVINDSACRLRFRASHFRPNDTTWRHFSRIAEPVTNIFGIQIYPIDMNYWKLLAVKLFPFSQYSLCVRAADIKYYHLLVREISDAFVPAKHFLYLICTFLVFLNNLFQRIHTSRV